MNDPGNEAPPVRRRRAAAPAADVPVAEATAPAGPVPALGDVIRHHPIVVIISTVSAVLAAILGGMWGMLAFIDTSVDEAVATQIAATREELIRTVNERAKMTRLYAIDAQGNRTGQLSDLIEAADDGRTIFVRYTREGHLEDGRPYRTEWFRACDGFSLDYPDQTEILTCFILRLPDTQIVETGREVVDPTAFEDYSVSTEGIARWRKYTIADGRIFENPEAFVAPGTDIQWWAAPAPLVVSTGN